MAIDLREIEATRLRVKHQFTEARCIAGNQKLATKLRILIEEQRATHTEALSVIAESFKRLPEAERLWVESRLNSDLANIIEGYALALGERAGECRLAKSA